ncbi:MAG: ECF transporter S component [Clostridia bacterium]|nr:ECF transporter S component [Clostridia bacterium]
MEMNKTRKIVLCAVLTAIVVVLQLAGASIRFGTQSISLVLIPIVIGATMCSISAGIWLGLVFGVVVLFTDSALFWAMNPAGTIITILLRGILTGLLTGLTFKALRKVNTYFAVLVSAIVCPIVNTGIFLAGCAVFFMDMMQQYAATMGFGENVFSFMIFGLAGVNFLLELGTNVILSPVIVRILHLRKSA